MERISHLIKKELEITSKRALATKLGVHQNMIDAYIEGTEPRQKNLEAIATYFKVSPAYLREETDDPKQIYVVSGNAGAVGSGVSEAAFIPFPPRIDKDLLSKALKSVDRLTKGMPVSVERKIDMAGSLYEDLYEAKYDGKEEDTKE